MRARKLTLLIVLLLMCTQAAMAQSVLLRDAPGIGFKPYTDSNSPAYWVGDTLYVLNSNDNPALTKGWDQFGLDEGVQVKWNREVGGNRWMECAFQDDKGVLYGYYHCEIRPLCHSDDKLTAPKIGAARSTDNGLNWTDLGFVLEATPGTLDCTYKNGFFAGGHGDFSGMLSRDKKYVYVFFSNYAGDVGEQGIGVARLPWKDRDKPLGKFRKFFAGAWDEPGVGGHVTPFFPAKASWKGPDCDALWGPSIHWNTYLKQYVVLMNRVKGTPDWPQDGVYVSFANNLADPSSWTKPEKIVDKGKWYPQVLGLNTSARETDKLCGQVGRYFIHGTSRQEIVFLKKGEDPSKLPPVYVPPGRTWPSKPKQPK